MSQHLQHRISLSLYRLDSILLCCVRRIILRKEVQAAIRQLQRQRVQRLSLPSQPGSSARSKTQRRNDVGFRNQPSIGLACHLISHLILLCLRATSHHEKPDQNTTVLCCVVVSSQPWAAAKTKKLLSSSSALPEKAPKPNYWHLPRWLN